MLAVATVKDEADIIAATVSAMLAQVDRAVIVDNGSTDGTSAILSTLHDTFGDRLTVVWDPELAYRQADRMTALAAHAEPGEWVVPFDADELWGHVDLLRDLDADVALARPFVHVPHPDDDPAEKDPTLRIRCRQAHPEPQPKVAFRWTASARLHMGNHGVSGVGDHHAEPGLDVRHFQYRTLEQTARKVREGTKGLVAAGLSDLIGTHWRTLAAMTDGELAAWWDEYLTQPTVLDPAPVTVRCPR